ncbi:MAG: protein-glutamate O-methyltransferase CheR [Gemmatimonadales bacterium]
MIETGDADGFAALTRTISTAAGLALEGYKDKCLRRRIAVRMRACGVHTFADYERLLGQDPAEYEKLTDALTINVTRFYRNADTWGRLARDVLPELWTARQGAVRVWSAGCSSGEEPYTLAMLLAAESERSARRSWLERSRIVATDIDKLCLERTRAARYPDAAFSETPPALTGRYTVPLSSGREIVPELRALVDCRRVDLLLDPVPGPSFDLITCRNVIIYFDRTSQERLFTRFVDALAPGGVLVLGKVETLFGPARERLDLIDVRERIFRRPA